MMYVEEEEEGASFTQMMEGRVERRREATTLTVLSTLKTSTISVGLE